MAEVPFWISIRDENWKQPERFNALFDKIPSKDKGSLDGYITIALPPLTNVPLDDISDEMVKRIIEYIHILEYTALDSCKS